MDEGEDNSAIGALSANVIETQYDSFDKNTIDGCVKSRL